MRELPDILDRRSLVPVGLVVTALLAVWAVLRVTVIPPAPAPEVGWRVPLWMAGGIIAIATGVSIVQIVRCAGVGLTRAGKWGIGVSGGVDLLAGVFLILTWTSGRPDVAGLARILLLMAVWAAFWTALDAYLRGATLTVAGTVLAVPVAMLLAWTLVHPDVPAVLGRDTTIGVLMLTLVLGTIGAIVWAGGIRSGRSWPEVVRGWLGLALLADGLGVWLLALAWDSGTMGLWHVVKLYLLLIGWLGLWTAFAILLRRWGPGPAVVLPMTLSFLLLALPATIVPVHRQLQAPGGVAAERVVGYAAYGCGTLGVLDAVSDAMPFSWTQDGGVMYRLTTLGQDAPWPHVVWWRQWLVFLGVAGVLGGVGAMGSRRE